MCDRGSIKLNQIVSLDGNISIDIFKEFDKSDDSKLSLNCNSNNIDGILLNCPNGGIYCNSEEFNIESRNNIKIGSLNNLKISSSNILELGNYEGSIILNNENSCLDINFIEKKNSYVKINTNNFSIINKNNSLILNDNIYNFKSKKKINIGNLYNNTLSIDCENDKIYINGDIFINGNMHINKISEYKNIINTINNNDLIFKLSNNPNKNWCIKDDNDESSIVYTNMDKSIKFKSKNEYINIHSKSINLHKEISDNIKYFTISNKLYIDNKCNFYTNGSINIDGNININDSIKLDNKGFIEVENDIIIDNYYLTNLFRYTVGINQKYENIQECIDFIVENNHYKNTPIFIEIYPNKIYKENIKIKHNNINLIGKYINVKIVGSLDINIEENNNFSSNNTILFKNLIIELISNIETNFFFKNNNIKFTNIEFYIKNLSKINIKNKNITFKNCKINGNKLLLESKKIIFINSLINLKNKILKSSEIHYSSCKIKINNDNFWKIDVEDTILVLYSEINSDIIFELFKNKIYCSKTIIILDSILKMNNKQGIFYPKLILVPNYK